MGHGKAIYEAMLHYEQVDSYRITSNFQKEPFEFAIDKPSYKFLSFFTKHYNLQYFKPQSNNFVIFDDFFIFNKDKKISQKYDFIRDSFIDRKNKDLNKINSTKRKKIEVQSKPEPIPERYESPPKPNNSSNKNILEMKQPETTLESEHDDR